MSDDKKKPVETYELREDLAHGSRVVNTIKPKTDKPASTLLSKIADRQQKK
ncbi:hypothetical protein [Rothia sp. CCM 9416]|uniref:hypothetical protein n=1 Tax=Rothia sp. CCM 9416 TaxID=3402655 RepID=UPI003AECC3AA